MDFISHILIGRMLASSRKKNMRSIYAVTFFSFLPDLTLIPLYIFLGFTNNRLFWIALPSDWDGFRSLHPLLSLLWEIPHSVFFAFLIILPIIFYFKLPKIAFIAYLSHILVDLFTHAGEWAMKPFYPFQYSFNGFTNAWSWSFKNMFITWFILLLIIFITHLILTKISKKEIKNFYD